MKLLVTGVAGTGKTTLCKELKKRQLACIDDATNGQDLGTWHDLEGNQLPHNVHLQEDFSWDNVQWGWDIPKLESFLNKNDPAIVCGYTGGIIQLAKKYFDRVVLLDATEDIINRRLRKRPFGYGFKRDERQQVLADLPQLRERLAPLEPEIVDASLPASKRADAIEKILKDSQ